MKQPKKIDSKKTSSENTKESNQQSYTAVGIVFLAVGLAMLLSGSTRAVGIPFVTLGATFFILGQQGSSSKRKK